MPIRANHPLPVFLSGYAGELEQWASRILKASILVIAVTVSGIAIAYPWEIQLRSLQTPRLR